MVIEISVLNLVVHSLNHRNLQIDLFETESGIISHIKITARPHYIITHSPVNYSKCRQSPDPMHRFMLDVHTLHSISNYIEYFMHANGFYGDMKSPERWKESERDEERDNGQW